MNLKKLQEQTQWHKLDEQNFRVKTTNTLLTQKESIEKLSDMVIQLTEEVLQLKKYINIIKTQNNFLNKKTKYNPGLNNDIEFEQKRNNRTIS